MARYFAHPFGPNWSQLNKIDTYNGHYNGALDMKKEGTDEDRGWPIYSLTNGTIHAAGWSNSAGYYVIVRTRDTGWSDWQKEGAKDLYVYYTHFLEAPLVKKGDAVHAGQQIGKEGSTGKSTGDHLHIDIRKTGDWAKSENSYPKVEPKMCSKYNELINNSRVKNWDETDNQSEANAYNYFIFANDPVWMGGTGTMSRPPGTEGLEDYYTYAIPEDFLIGGGYTLEDQKKRLARLCQREVGLSQSGSEESLSGQLLYAKLIRMRALYGTGNVNDGGDLITVFSKNGFSGWSEAQMPLISDLPPGVSMDSFIELCYQNFIYPDCVGLLDYHASIASYGPYYNFGYSVCGYSNVISNETTIASGIVNATLPSHLDISGKPSYGGYYHNNSNYFIGMVGNTGYFGANSCYSFTAATQPILKRQ